MNKSEGLNGITEEFIHKGAGSIEEDDIQRVLDRASDIINKIVDTNPLKRFYQDVKLLIALIRDYKDGAYRKTPRWVIAVIVFVLLYVLNPMDLIPNFIPVLGLIDDAAVMAMCLAMTEQDILKYQNWKR